ncbi:MAG: polyprenyl synthetase family protein [Clostridia bacterium]|nr:polyprenyl synthetase family protein [Clostridia bacterium]
MKDYRTKYEEYRSFTESILEEAVSRMNCHTEVLQESIRYSLLAGGKRIRPVLFLAMLETLGLDYHNERALAVAIECIHTYSLIHDDLPAMDNDDFRRGKPSNHKVFGEANAILAGDGLLSYAFELLIKECYKGVQWVNAAKTLAEAAGLQGMVAGQSADILHSGKPVGEVGEVELEMIHYHKTANLIAAPLVMAANLAEKYEKETREFGMSLGFLFQVTDDILDEIGEEKEVGKTLGKDKAEGKLTCVKVYGMEKTLSLRDSLTEKCLSLLGGIEADTCFLKDLVVDLRNRNK